MFLLQMMVQCNTTPTCRVKQRSLRMSGRDDRSKTSYCHLILGSNSCKIFCQTSSVLTCRKCTVCQSSWPCMQGIALHCITDNTCNDLITNLS